MTDSAPQQNGGERGLFCPGFKLRQYRFLTGLVIVSGAGDPLSLQGQAPDRRQGFEVAYPLIDGRLIG